MALGVIVLPVLARAHPGHSAFDVSAGPPHQGHELEIAAWLAAAALTAVLCGARWLFNRRR